MPTQRAALIRAAFEFVRAFDDTRPLMIEMRLSDSQRITLDLPAVAPAAPVLVAPSARDASPDGMKILAAVREYGPAAVKEIIERTRIEKSRCYVLVDDMAQRGLIVDHGDGYEITATPRPES